MIGPENVFDGPFPKAQRRGNTTRWVLRRSHSANPTFFVKEFLQAHDKLASPQINRFSLGHMSGNLHIKSFRPTQIVLSDYIIHQESTRTT